MADEPSTQPPSTEQSPAEVPQPAGEAAAQPRVPRIIALIGEMPFCGSAVARALVEDGFIVRALCPDEASEQKLRAAMPTAPKGELQCVRGALDSAEALREILNGAFGAAFLSPIALHGRMFRAAPHLDDVRRFWEAVKAARTPRVLYHSSVSAHPESRTPCLAFAAAGEEMIKTLDADVFRLRTSLLMGPGDRFQSELLQSAKSGSPVLGVLGYGTTPVQPVHIRDMALSVARIFGDDPQPLEPGVYSLAGPETTTPLDLIDMALLKVGRFKVKVHAPLFVLKLIAAAGASAEFREKVSMLFEVFCADRNDSVKLLGPIHRMITPEQSQQQILGAA